MRVKPAREPGAAPPVVAVVPARNETERWWARPWQSLAKQQYAGAFHIILVDDHSGDGTAAIARAAAPPERLTVARLLRLPKAGPGKCGRWPKGVRQAAAVPAGIPAPHRCRYRAPARQPGGTGGARRAKSGRGYDLVSYMATLRCQSAGGARPRPRVRLLFFPALSAGVGHRRRRAAACWSAARCWSASAASRRSPASASTIARWPRAVRRAGGRVWLGPGGGTRSIREYGTFAEIGRMISRSAFTQLRYSGWLLAGTCAGLLLTLCRSAGAGAGGVVVGRGGVGGDEPDVRSGAALLPRFRRCGRRCCRWWRCSTWARPSTPPSCTGAAKGGCGRGGCRSVRLSCLKLAAVDYVILALYFAFVLGIGWMLRKKVSTSGDFLSPAARSRSGSPASPSSRPTSARRN